MSSKLISQGRDRLTLTKAPEDDPASQAAGAIAAGPGADLDSGTDRGSIMVISLEALPAPYPATGDGELSGSEHGYLAACEAALENLARAFWAAGKALQVIRDGRLYRETHATFEDYVEQRWGFSRPQAYKLMAAWPLAERLSPIGDKLNQRLRQNQVLELLPVAASHGQDAAVVVYSTVAEADGVDVTAAVLRGVVGVLPDGPFDPAEAADQIRAYLAGGPAGPPRPAADPVGAFAAESAKILRVLKRVSARGMLQAAVDADPAVVRKVIADVRALLDDIEGDVAARPAGDAR